MKVSSELKDFKQIFLSLALEKNKGRVCKSAFWKSCWVLRKLELLHYILTSSLPEQVYLVLLNSKYQIKLNIKYQAILYSNF